jgi:3-hydroxybutyrate dehydrogenase
MYVLFRPEDVAEAAVFLASFPSSALAGQSLIARHGWRMP